MTAVTFHSYSLQFKKPATTSRGTLTGRNIYILQAGDQLCGYGEAGTLPGLSLDDSPVYEQKLQEVCTQLTHTHNWTSKSTEELSDLLQILYYPSILFAIESALLDLKNGGRFILFDTPFSQSKAAVPINGLVWMDSAEHMLLQVKEKIASGYRCIKLKIGSLDFDEECRLLESIRKQHNAHQIELRVDANGAFSSDHVFEQLNDLSRFEIHSIEQPVKAGQWDLMQEVCAKSKIPVALDEELIGVAERAEDGLLLKKVKPAYLILKPSLLGGFSRCDSWIKKAHATGIGYWITSALESNVGLNALAQYASTLPVTIPQGLGTGQLYTNNIESPLTIEQGALHYKAGKTWNLQPSFRSRELP